MARSGSGRPGRTAKRTGLPAAMISAAPDRGERRQRRALHEHMRWLYARSAATLRTTSESCGIPVPLEIPTPTVRARAPSEKTTTPTGKAERTSTLAAHSSVARERRVDELERSPPAPRRDIEAFRSLWRKRSRCPIHDKTAATTQRALQVDSSRPSVLSSPSGPRRPNPC